ncbi:MAG: hypothetical protein WKF75_15420, partial [Singulisphaera sp.]
FLGGRYFNPAAASAATILRQVRVAHARGVDRCYRVHYAPDPRYWDGAKTLEGPSDSVLWTRGDRFWSECAIGQLRLAIGREEDGTLWVSPSRKKDRFAGGNRNCRKRSRCSATLVLTVSAAMDDVLVDFDLNAEGHPRMRRRRASSGRG